MGIAVGTNQRPYFDPVATDVASQSPPKIEKLAMTLSPPCALVGDAASSA